MVRTRTAAKPATPDPEPENADNLEVISIGSLYNGPWDKKYWSSSRGKDRYPYPVGYQAVRAHNGTTYKMEIVEGINGPRFLISSDDGNSASGKTPDFAWEEFLKKGCTRVKIWHGKRLSSKMDGLELFGFKNQFIQRLLRELVADINGISEQSLVSSNSCNEVSKTVHDACPHNVGTCPDILISLGRSRVTGKRSRCELKNKNLNGKSGDQSLERACSRAPDVKNETNCRQGSSTTHNGSEDDEGTHNKIDVSPSLQIMASVGERSNCNSSHNGMLLNPIDISSDKKYGAVILERQTGFLDSPNHKTTEMTENTCTEKPLHRSLDVEMKMSNLLVTVEDDKVVHSCSNESQGRIGIDLCAPDTLDLEDHLLQCTAENSSDSAPSNLDKNIYSEPVYEVTSEELLNSKHEEVIRSDSNLSSEKNEFNLAGQDVANSMMSLLLPQAVPLLRNVSTDEKFTHIPSDMLPSTVTNSKQEQNEVGRVLDVPSSEEKMVTDDAYEEHGEKIHRLNTDPSSNSPNTEHMKSIVLDSYEYSQCEDLKNSEILSFDIAEAGRSSLIKEMCSPKSQEELPGYLPNGPSTCCGSEFDFKNRLPDYDVTVPDSVLDDMSTDVCIPYSSPDNMSPLHGSFNSMQNDLPTTQAFTGGTSNEISRVQSKICHLKSMESLAEKAQDEAIGKTDNDKTITMSSSQLPKLVTHTEAVGKTDNDKTNTMSSSQLPKLVTQAEAVGKTNNDKTMTMSSSQLPLLVYTRRKRKKSVTLQGNCSSLESTESDKIELVTPQTHTTRGTVPPSKTIQTKNVNDKLCQPDDSAGLLLETPQAHSGVPDVQSNLVELNPSSPKPNPFSCENKYTGGKGAQFISEPMAQRNQELHSNLNNVKFVGCYMHPMPVSSLLLRTREDEIYICVLSGLPMGQHRTLFTYKVAIKEPNFGCPSVMAHTPIMLPDREHNFTSETNVERTGVELTPDGQYIVLIGSIKIPNCREGKIDCCCSTCTSVCSKKNALKIVHVEHGYASVMATLEAVEDVHCILVCEPNRLVSVGESGRLQVWVMNSTWSEKREFSIIPPDGSMSPGIVELKRVPKFAHLVVGRNVCGEFSLWDITKLNCVSSFSASKYPITQFIPVSLFHLQTKGLGFSYASIEETAEELLEATDLWHSEKRDTCLFPPSEEDVAMWFLVSTPTDFDCCQNHVSTSSPHDVHTAQSWRLALLVKNSIAFGSPLDSRTTAIGVSGGCGIISTNDGVVYMWEMSRGSKLDTLHHFQGGIFTSLATDDLNSISRSAMGVAGGGGQLLLYLHLRKQNSNE